MKGFTLFVVSVGLVFLSFTMSYIFQEIGLGEIYNVLLAFPVIISSGTGIAGIILGIKDKKGGRRTLGLVGNAVIVVIFSSFIIAAIVESDDHSNDNPVFRKEDEMKVRNILKEVNSDLIWMHLEPTNKRQINIEIHDSEEINEVLSKPEIQTQRTDSIFRLSTDIASRINIVLDGKYVYENILLSFYSNGEQQYSFDFNARTKE
jgi:hypothetical protein